MPVVELMSFMFDNDIIDAVEVDVRTVAESTDDTVFITHDAIPLDLSERQVEARAYLRANTLSKFLQGFAANDAFVEQRRIYIEIKTDRKSGPLSESDKTLIERMVLTMNSTLDSLLIEPARQQRVREKIGFVSFNLEALRHTHLLLADRPMAIHTYHQILSTNRPLLKHLFAKLTDEMIEQINRSPWLTGVWLDPRAIKGLEETITAIRACNPEIKLGLSTYYSGHDRFAKMLKDRKLKGIECVIAEIDYGRFPCLKF